MVFMYGRLLLCLLDEPISIDESICVSAEAILLMIPISFLCLFEAQAEVLLKPWQ